MKAMRHLLIFLAVLLVSTFASAGKTICPPSPNVTTIIHDFDLSGNQLLLRSDDYQGSGLGQASYSAALDPNLTSDLYCGVWYLRMYSQSVRTVWITPNEPIDSSQPTAPPPGYYSVYVEGTSHCYDQNLNLVYFNNVLSSSGNCGLNFDFGYNGVKYKISMSPSLPAPGPATGLVTVACNVVSSGQCVNWTLTPNLAASTSHPPTVANLYYYAQGGKLTFIGQYHNTFRIDLTNP